MAPWSSGQDANLMSECQKAAGLLQCHRQSRAKSSASCPRNEECCDGVSVAHQSRHAMKAAVAVGLGAALFGTAIAVSQADAASSRKRGRSFEPPPPAVRVVQPPADRFMACDVRVRDNLREGGATA